MGAAAVDVAKSVAALLNANGFRCERTYAEFDDVLKDLDSEQIDVVPNQSGSSELIDQTSVKYVCLVDIGLRKHFSEAYLDASGTVKVEELDLLVARIEAIHEFFLHPVRRELPNSDGAKWIETTLVNRFNREHLRQHKQYTGLLRLGYEVTKDLA